MITVASTFSTLEPTLRGTDIAFGKVAADASERPDRATADQSMAAQS